MVNSGKRALVTGGVGFIGSHLCDALLEKGYSVVCLDNMSTGHRDNISSALKDPGFALEERDACEPLDYEVDCVFHLASPASPVDYYAMQVETMRANSLGTMNCLELARRTGCRLIMASTSEVYGDPQVTPQREDYFGHVNPVGPRSCYDEGKRFSEALCKAYEREHQVEVVIVRIFNTYGTRMRERDGRVIPNFVCQALDGEPLTIYGDGGQTRSFCHVSDMVRGLMLAMSSAEAPGEVINLGNPNEMRVIDVAGRIRRKVASSSEMVFENLPVDDPLQRKPDISKAMSMLGWAPEVELEAGLDDVIAWFRENR
jgi:nucleoside-diphosphate-sugar epimerase